MTARARLNALLSLRREILAVEAELAIMDETITDMRDEASPALRAVLQTRNSAARASIKRVVTDLKDIIP